MSKDMFDSQLTRKNKSAVTSGVNGLENMSSEHGVAKQIRSLMYMHIPVQTI